MKIKDLLSARPSGRIQTDISPRALEKWNPALNAAATDDNSIGIFDVIGSDYYGEGVTSKRISAALRSIGPETPVTVNINSPGGDLFEGLSIYNMLREHKGQVTVKVLSLAASAASIIAMAGDEIQISRSGFLMIHNSWVLAMGNRHDLTAVADYLAPFDQAMADIYAVRTGLDISKAEAMMDAETWIGGTSAIDQGFADNYLPSDQVIESGVEGSKIAAHKIDIALAKSGMSRSERRKILNQLKSSTQTAAGGGTPSATVTDKPSAVVNAEPLTRLTFTL